MHHHCRHPCDMGGSEVQVFINQLVQDHRPAASTQNQAIQALCFLYRHVVRQPLSDVVVQALRPKRPVRLPHIPSRHEIGAFINRLTGAPRLVAILQYGSGLRLKETLQVRIRDFRFEKLEIHLQDRSVPLDANAIWLFKDQIRSRKIQDALDDDVFLVGNRRTSINEVLAWRPLHPLVVQKAYRATGSGISSTSLRMAFGAHLLDRGVHVRLVQELLGQKDIQSALRLQNFKSRWPDADVDLISHMELHAPRPSSRGIP